jgi:hypothetical protein
MRRLVLLVVVCIGCKNESGTEPFDTYQDCFDKLVETDKQMVEDAIVECCIDHPIDGVKPVCKDTTPDCINFLTANLNQTSASTVEVMEACQAYIDEREMRGM